LSDPREIAEKAQKERLEAQRELEKQAKERERAKKTKAAKIPEKTGKTETVTKPPETKRDSETEFQSDIKDTGPAADAIREKEKTITVTQKREGEESAKELSKKVEMAAIKQEKWVQENVMEPAREAASKRKETAQNLKAQGRNIEAGIAMSSYVASNVAIGFIEEATTPLRPKAIQRDIQAGKDLYYDTPQQVKSDQQHGHVESEKVGTRELVISGIAADPAAFVGQVGGGILAGAVVGDLAVKGYDKFSGTERVKVSQLDDVKIRDVDLSGRGAPIKTEIKPTNVKTRYSRVPSGSYDDAFDVRPDTLLGTVEGQGFKLGVGADNLADLREGKTIYVDRAMGELIETPEGYKPIIGFEDIEANPLKDTPGVRRLAKTTGSEQFKELGYDSPFDMTPPTKPVKADVPTTMKVTGLAELAEEGGDLFEHTKPYTGKHTPWDLAEQKQAVSGTQKILKEGPPEPDAPSSRMWKRIMEEGPPDPLTELKQKYRVKAKPASLRRVQRAPSGQHGWWLGAGGGVGALGETTSQFSRESLKDRSESEQSIITGEKQESKTVPRQWSKMKMEDITGIKFDLSSWVREHPEQTPIVVPDQVPDQTPRQTPRQTPAQIIEPTPDDPGFRFTPPYTPPSGSRRARIITPRDQRKKRVKTRGPLVGYEERSYKLLTPEEIKGKRRFKI